MVVYAGTKGYLDEVPLSRIAEFQNAFLAYVDASVPQLRQGLAEKGAIRGHREPTQAGIK